MSPESGGSPTEESMDLLSLIIQRLNEVYGIELCKEDEVDLKNVSQRMSKNLELELVMVGQNSDDDKKDFFNKLLKDEVSEYYGDRLDFYKKIMNTKVFPMILEGMYREYGRGLRK